MIEKEDNDDLVAHPDGYLPRVPLNFRAHSGLVSVHVPRAVVETFGKS